MIFKIIISIYIYFIMYQNFDKSNFSINWNNPACSKLENIYDSYLTSKDNNKIIPFFPLEKIEENKEFLKNMDSHIDERTFCELTDCNKDEISDKLKKLYSFLNQCKKSMEEYNKKFEKFQNCTRYLFNPYTGEYDDDLKFKHIDRFYSLYKDIDSTQLEKELKKYNKVIDSYDDFHEEIILKRAYCSQIEKLKELSIDIQKFLELG